MIEVAIFFVLVVVVCLINDAVKGVWVVTLFAEVDLVVWVEVKIGLCVVTFVNKDPLVVNIFVWAIVVEICLDETFYFYRPIL